MGSQYLIDTNVIIEFFNGDLPERGNEFLLTLAPKISIITSIELLSWPDADDNDLLALNNFINDCTVYDLDKFIIEKTIKLRRAKRLKIGDAIIAATSITHGLSLITRNTKDFKGIDGLVIIDLHRI